MAIHICSEHFRTYQCCIIKYNGLKHIMRMHVITLITHETKILYSITAVLQLTTPLHRFFHIKRHDARVWLYKFYTFINHWTWLILFTIKSQELPRLPWGLSCNIFCICKSWLLRCYRYQQKSVQKEANMMYKCRCSLMRPLFAKTTGVGLK